MRYITPEGQTAIRQFKYKGGSLSVSYKHVWGPLAQLFLKITPETVAPNTITLVGFLAHVIGTIILVLQGPFKSQAPSWSLWLYGIGVMAYHTLDNMDGKQARKLGNSTPLGMIMDHGFDALGLIFLSLGMSRIICIDFDLILWVFTFGVTFTFYLSAWCQYHSQGIMILGVVNAVDDGIPAIALFSFYSAIFGQSLWLTPILGNDNLGSLVAKFVAFSGVIQAYSLYSQSGDKFTTDLTKAMKDLYHLVLIGFAVYSLSAHSNLVDPYFYWIITGIGLTMARTISYTLVCSVSQMKFEQFHASVLIVGIIYPIYVYFGQRYLDAKYVIYPITIFVALQYFYFVYNVCNHIADVLNIKIFRVFDPKQLKKQ